MDRHRLVEDGVCSSDLAVHGLRELFGSGELEPSSIDALVVVSSTPDYFLPPTSSVIHGQLGLHEDILCVDIVQGCAGFLGLPHG